MFGDELSVSNAVESGLSSVTGEVVAGSDGVAEEMAADVGSSVRDASVEPSAVTVADVSPEGTEDESGTGREVVPSGPDVPEFPVSGEAPRKPIRTAQSVSATTDVTHNMIIVDDDLPPLTFSLLFLPV